MSEGIQTTDFQGFLYSGTDFFLGNTPVPKSQGHFVVDLGFGDHLVGVLHDVADMIGPLLDA